MILLREKGAHGASARCEQICMLLPQRSQGSTLKNHMLLIANTTTVASQTDPISPAHMASTSQTASSMPGLASPGNHDMASCLKLGFASGQTLIW